MPEPVATASTKSFGTPKSGKSTSKSGKSGLTSVADAIHKNEDLSKLSEAEQLELAMRASQIESLSPEEQVHILHFCVHTFVETHSKNISTLLAICVTKIQNFGSW